MLCEEEIAECFEEDLYTPIEHEYVETTEAVSMSYIDKPKLSDYNAFGLGYDVILLAIAYTLAISFVVSAMREIGEHLHGKGKVFNAARAVLESHYIVPVTIGAVSGPFALDLIVRLAGYHYVETSAAIYLGICAGALSSPINAILYRYLDRFHYKPKSENSGNDTQP